MNINVERDMTEQQVGPRVLVVEDDPMQAMKVEALLQAVGCTVRIAANGREALTAMGEECPDIVVSDILMPEMDGYEMCKRIRSRDELKRVGVILLTCLSEPQDVIRGLEAGADNFLAKPYESSGLIRMVTEMHEGRTAREKEGTKVHFRGKSYVVNSTRGQILNFFLTLYEDTLWKNEELARTQQELQYVNENLARLVHERTADLSREVESRKNAEEESRERAQLLDKAQDAILVLDLDGIIRYSNRSARNLYGWSEPEMLGRHASLLLYDDKRPFPMESMAAVQEKGEWVGELRQVTMGGHEVLVMSSWTLVRDDKLRPRSILCINTNLTNRKKPELQLPRAHPPRGQASRKVDDR
jgi:PAS domain S-box-containing protein